VARRRVEVPRPMRSQTSARPPAPWREARLRRRLADACHVLAMEGQGDAVWGHATVRPPGSSTFWMKPAGLGLEEVRPGDMILVDLEGRIVHGKRPRHSEVFIHSEIFRARPEVGAVVHTHPVPSAVFASLGVPLRPITHEGTNFVPPDVPRFAETTDLIVTAARGRAVARTLGDRPALFLVSHGIVAVGVTVEEAAVNALLLDRAAGAQLLLRDGVPRHWTADEEALEKRRRIYHADSLASRWAYLLRRLARWRHLRA
jgi:L-ribulose-5-phosphate 4-epimerase